MDTPLPPVFSIRTDVSPSMAPNGGTPTENDAGGDLGQDLVHVSNAIIIFVCFSHGKAGDNNTVLPHHNTNMDGSIYI